MNSIIRYFDLNRDLRPNLPTGMSNDGSALNWQFQYIALLLGIVIQPYFAHYQQHKAWSTVSLPGWILFSIIVAIISFPGIYRQSFDPSKPLILQLIPIFTAGLGWQSIFATAMSAAGK